jgi:hypothetical protein
VPQKLISPTFVTYILRYMKVEIVEAVVKLAPDQLERFRRWFAAFSRWAVLTTPRSWTPTATKLVCLAGRALSELKRRANEP